ncbi:MAG: ABC transporter permease [Planctomycetota bacterium]
MRRSSVRAARTAEVRAFVEGVGRKAVGIVEQTGSTTLLMFEALGWVWRAVAPPRARLGVVAISTQVVRAGVRAVFIVSLVSGAVGLILTLQMAPPLEEFGSKATVANIVGVAVLRELGPLIAAIVMTGFAGAAIAAEIGTMVVGEEIEALEVHALDPVRFLVVPRVVAAVVSMLCVTVIANAVSIGAALVGSKTVLGIPYVTFWENFLFQVSLADYLTGLAKSVVFGLLIGAIACANGLRVTGGAMGVGNATTSTVVQCVVSIVIADLLFTATFFALGLH